MYSEKNNILLFSIIHCGGIQKWNVHANQRIS